MIIIKADKPIGSQDVVIFGEKKGVLAKKGQDRGFWVVMVLPFLPWLVVSRGLFTVIACCGDGALGPATLPACLLSSTGEGEGAATRWQEGAQRGQASRGGPTHFGSTLTSFSEYLMFGELLLREKQMSSMVRATNLSFKSFSR